MDAKSKVDEILLEKMFENGYMAIETNPDDGRLGLHTSILSLIWRNC